MPAYFVSTPDPLSSEHTRSVVDIITKVHCELTGATPLLVTVLFSNRVPLRKGAKAYIKGNVRRGRDFEIIQALSAQIKDLCSTACAWSPDAIDVELFEVPAEWMMEHGQLIPQAGADTAWLTRMGALERSQQIMQSLNARMHRL